MSALPRASSSCHGRTNPLVGKESPSSSQKIRARTLVRDSSKSSRRQHIAAASSVGLVYAKAAVVEEFPLVVDEQDQVTQKSGGTCSDLSLESLFLRQAFPVADARLQDDRFGERLEETPASLTLEDEEPHFMWSPPEEEWSEEDAGIFLGTSPHSASGIPSERWGVLQTPCTGGAAQEHPDAAAPNRQREVEGVFGAVVQSQPPPSTEEKDKLGSDYHVNVGYAIRTLREELPTMFYKDMTYDIYRDDITFQDPLNTFRGLKNYKTIFWALRFHGRIFFKSLQVDVNRIWQPNDKTITIRWSVRGVPRVPWEAWGRFDGTSEYKLDSDGKIYAHKVDNIVLSDPPRYRPLTVVELLQLSGARQTPGITCFSSQASPTALPVLAAATTYSRGVGSGEVAGITGGSRQMPVEKPASWVRGWTESALRKLNLGPVSWYRFYLALTGTLALQDDLEFAAKVLLLG